MSKKFKVGSVNISQAKGTVKQSVDRITIDARGIVGDAHAGMWHRQVSLLSQDRIDDFVDRTGRPVEPGEFAENITVRGLDLRDAAPLDRFCMDAVELEVTQIGKECHGDQCAIFREVGQCIMPTEGLFARVIRGGQVGPGDSGEFHPRDLKFKVITLSDRAAVGEYADRSGPEVCRMLDEHFQGKRWHVRIDSTILPDEAEALKKEIQSARDAGVDVVITTGSTGVAPRDIAPETVEAMCRKTIPGIMENIRLKFGADKPNALLSRSVAGVTDTTQIYALPGSVRAVREYMGEILKTLEHLIFMLHGIDAH